MADSAESGRKRGQVVRAVLAALAVLLLALFVPPFVSVSHYKAQITNLISRSLNRPVRLSNVEVRLLPWPGFVLDDLSVAEDPAYGAEPVLHASQVKASIRMLALLRGRLEIGTISVDEASLNVVRVGPGQWNLDTLFRTAASQTGARSGSSVSLRLPTLEATNSRVDFKSGAEKLPFSLVNADLTVWQDQPGEWRVRLRGQPARTDVSLYLEDTGVVRMEADVKRAPAMREMPIHLDLDWRQAQLGQLARLVTGSDSGWRGDLTGEVHVDGTAEAAQVAIRLRASGVHREEFVPASPMDFDANCNFLFHYTSRNFEKVVCDSPLGDGHVHLTGAMPGNTPPSFTAELNRVPVGAGLDALRTLRSGLQADLEAAGTVSGKLIYMQKSAPVEPPPLSGKRNSASRIATDATEELNPFSGSVMVENLSLSGGGLSRPIQAQKIVFAPVSSTAIGSRALIAAVPRASSGQSPPAALNSNEGLAGSVTIPSGGAVPLTLSMRFSLSGYLVAAHGQASIPRARELAHAAGIPATSALDSLAGEPIAIDVVAQGPWLPREAIPADNLAPVDANTEPLPIPTESSANPAPIDPSVDTLTGTVSLRNANWKADYLANHLQIDNATLHLEPGALRWNPIDFTYGTVKGTATISLPWGCPQPGQPCPAPSKPSFALTFVDLDAASAQTALLGAHEPGTLLSTLIDRLHPSTAPPWPAMNGTVAVDTLVLSPVSIDHVYATIEIRPDGANIPTFTGNMLGGNVQLAGTLHKPASDQDKPAYSLNGNFENCDAKALGQLLGLKWTGSSIGGNGKVDLSGYTGADLSSTAKGMLHIESRNGSIASLGKSHTEVGTNADKVPEALAHFERFTADAIIANGAVTLGPNQVVSAGRKRSVFATVTLADPPAVSFEAPKPSVAKH